MFLVRFCAFISLLAGCNAIHEINGILVIYLLLLILAVVLNEVNLDPGAFAATDQCEFVPLIALLDYLAEARLLVV